MEEFVLSNGVRIPKIGFGTWQAADGQQAIDAVKWALEAGYRHIDTAYNYEKSSSALCDYVFILICFCNCVYLCKYEKRRMAKLRMESVFSEVYSNIKQKGSRGCLFCFIVA